MILFAYLGFTNNWCAGEEPGETLSASASMPNGTPSPSAALTSLNISSDQMPDLRGKHLDEALLAMDRQGISDIYVTTRYGVSADKVGTVVEQSLEPGVNIPEQGSVCIAIGREAHGKYKADVSFTVNIPDNDAKMYIVYRTSNAQNIDYTVVLYENTVAKQDMFTVSATLYSNDAVTRTLYLLINGEEVRSQDVKFAE